VLAGESDSGDEKEHPPQLGENIASSDHRIPNYCRCFGQATVGGFPSK
jgi:hypothetical protein